MNKTKTAAEKSKELFTFFKFFLFVQLIIGLVFLLNGPIKSNLGYDPVEMSAKEDPTGEGGGQRAVTPQQPRVIQPKNIGILKQNWTIPRTPPASQNFIANLEKKIFDESNKQRSNPNRNLQTVTWEDNLAGTARYHSSDMGTRNFFSHINPDNVGPFFRISKLHRRYIGTGGENIIKISKDSTDPDTMARKIVNNWMNSTGHRQNILNKDYTSLGVGCIEVPGPNNIPLIYATQLFGTAAAYLQNDFPVELSKGQEETVGVQCTHPEYLAPISGETVDLNSRQVDTFQLTAASDRLNSSGKIKAPAQPGVYQLVFYFPFKKNPGTVAVIPGPIFSVK
jgi:uncharacterized protein YkwD